MQERVIVRRSPAARLPRHQPRPRPSATDSGREYDCALVRALLRARRP